MNTVEDLEVRLDEMAAEALRREAHRLDLAGAGRDERATAMAAARSTIKAWRDRATAAALLSSVSAGRPA